MEKRRIKWNMFEMMCVWVMGVGLNREGVGHIRTERSM